MDLDLDLDLDLDVDVDVDVDKGVGFRLFCTLLSGTFCTCFGKQSCCTCSSVPVSL